VIGMATSTLHAESVDWTQDRVIDIPLIPSSQSRTAPRQIVFLGGPLTSVSGSDDPNILTVDQRGNTLSLQLDDASFQGTTLFARDEAGRLFVLRLRRASADENPDPVVWIRIPSASAQAGASGSQEMLGEASDLMIQMLGGQVRADIAGTAVTEVRDGTMQVGQIIDENDRYRITLMAVYQSPRLRGYQCVFTHKSTTEPLTIAYQDLHFPGMIMVSVADQGILDPMNPRASVGPGASINLFFVGQ
jgi:hypothetical protein